uniref:Uncharacterized protein n=1 Tax=Glossina brevipalpis TaxID=37001 RepID=A0A1A9WKU2_9MUSC
MKNHHKNINEIFGKNLVHMHPCHIRIVNQSELPLKIYKKLHTELQSKNTATDELYGPLFKQKDPQAISLFMHSDPDLDKSTLFSFFILTNIKSLTLTLTENERTNERTYVRTTLALLTTQHIVIGHNVGVLWICPSVRLSIYFKVDKVIN